MAFSADAAAFQVQVSFGINVCVYFCVSHFKKWSLSHKGWIWK
jgi:hypothetical protein